jgi:predicted AlkP superfamily phosphohydrolase/phosphomutase
VGRPLACAVLLGVGFASGPLAESISPPRSDAAAAARGSPSERGVILIGWDGADWELLDALVAAGRLPNLRRLVAEGRTANLSVFSPMISPLVWSTIATGAEPPDHGVLDFFEIDPNGGRQVPVSARSLRVPPYWDLASARGQTVGVVDYWASYPAEEVRGFVISDRVCPALADPDPSQLASAVFPPGAADRLRSLLSANPLPGPDELRRFGDFTAAELVEPRAGNLARLIRNTRVSQLAAEDFYDRIHPRSLVLYFLGTDEIAHMFAQDTAPRLPCIAPETFRRLSEVVPRYYAWVDELLGRWMDRARRDGRVLLLVSDHGFQWGSRRSCQGNPLAWNSASYAHRPVGIVAAWGSGVARNKTRGTVSVFDIEPTIAALLDLPVDRRAPGKARVEWFEGCREPRREDVWASFSPPRRLPAVVPQRNEYAERLKSLGYLTGGEAAAVRSPAGMTGRTATAWLNLGNYWVDRGRRDQAVSAFREALSIWPGYPPAVVNLVGTLVALHRGREAVETARLALDRPGERAEWTIYEVAARLEAGGLVQAEEALLTEALRRFPNSEPIVVSLAGLDMTRGRCEAALQKIRPFLTTCARPDDLNVAGLALLCLGRPAEARPLLERSLTLTPNQPHIRAALNRTARGPAGGSAGEPR